MGLADFFTGDHDGLDFDRLHDAFAWVRAMAHTPQDPRFHAEGDVWTHTRMVCDALIADELWPMLDSAGRRLMLAAALFHDAGKPEVTFTDPHGRIRSPDHSRRGELLARRELWLLEETFEFREAVAALVRQHMQPRYVPEQKDPRRRVFGMSLVLRCDLLAMLARADTRGRSAPEYDASLRRIQRFVDFCDEHECLTRPRRFATDHARFLYFRRMHDDPDSEVPDPAGPVMTVMSGLPGSGKDSWIAQHRPESPVVSLDGIRLELGISPAAEQEPVVTLARARAARLLAAGSNLIWNATTLSPRRRASVVDLAVPYDAWIEIVHVDAPPSLLIPRNSSRSGVARVPDAVIDRMTRGWHPPDLTEAHRVTNVVHTAAGTARKAS